MEVLSYHDPKREEVVEFLPSNYNKVLEIGCGTGEFRKNLLILLFGPDSRYCQFGFCLISNSKTS